MLERSVVEKIQAEAICLYTAETIAHRIAGLAADMAVSLAAQNPVICCVMNGGMMFASALLAEWDFPLQLDYVHTSRYREGTQGRELVWQAMPKIALQDRCVLVVDDILDEGKTLLAITEAVRAQGAQQVLSAVLVEKQHRRRVAGSMADYVGLAVDDRYVFGFGMDYHGYFRNLTSIYALGARV